MLRQRRRACLLRATWMVGGCLLLSSCSTKPTSETAASASVGQNELGANLAEFAEHVGKKLTKPSASNSYSYETAYDLRSDAEPPIWLTPTPSHSAFASTDCSGWVSFAIVTVSPLHQAVIQSQRRLPEYNRAYADGFELHEGRRPWSRAFVLADYLRSDYAGATGFEGVAHFAELRGGEVGAYAMGRYTKPADATLTKTPDTGHTFIVAGAPTKVDPSTPGYDGEGSLSERATQVVAVPVVDSSSLIHFPPDPRANAEGEYSLPPNPPPKALPGGIGLGTLWFALDEDGRVLQRRFDAKSDWVDVAAAAGRMRPQISLRPDILDAEGDLVVNVYSNAPADFAGTSYDRPPVDVTGNGGIRLVGDGRFVLNGNSTFTGGVTVESGELIVASKQALGGGDLEVRGGMVTLEEPSLPDDAMLTVAGALEMGALRLDFSGRDKLRALRIGGATHTCGTWGAPGSRAEFTHSVFSGTGVLELTAHPGPGCGGDVTDAKKRGAHGGP